MRSTGDSGITTISINTLLCQGLAQVGVSWSHANFSSFLFQRERVTVKERKIKTQRKDSHLKMWDFPSVSRYLHVVSGFEPELSPTVSRALFQMSYLPVPQMQHFFKIKKQHYSHFTLKTSYQNDHYCFAR